MKKAVVFIVFILMVTSVSARDWYVNNQAGNCDNAGVGTLSVPLCDIATANSRHSGGDTVYVMPGNYRESLYPKSGTGSNDYTVYSGYGAADNIYILGSVDVSGGWIKCSEADPNCQAISDHIYYKHWTSEAKRVAFYRMDGGVPDCYDYYVDYAYYRCAETNAQGYHTDIPTKYETDCWEDREGWYMRADLEEVSNPRLSTLRGLADLTSPGMFYYDHDYDTPSNSLLYIWPFGDDAANNHQIECSQRRIAGWSQYDTPSYGPLNYVTVQNLTLMHSLVNGINLHSGTQFLTIQDNIIAYNSGQGTAGENPSAILKNSASGLQDGIKILRNEIHHQGSDKGPGMLYQNWHSGLASTLYSVDNTLIEGNHFHHLSEGIYVKHGGPGSTISYRNVTFKDNVIHDIAFHAISYGSGGDQNTFTGTVEGNVIYNIWDGSFEGGAIDTRIHNNNVKIYGNTIFNVSSRGIGIEVANNPGTGHEIYNNLLLDMQTIGLPGSFISLYSGTMNTAQSDYNLYYETEGSFGVTAPGNVWSARTNYATLSDWQTATTLDQHSQYVDPLVVDSQTHDFTLTEDSPAIDAGTLIPGYHCDTAGVESFHGCRMWYGEAPDIGAIEYVPEQQGTGICEATTGDCYYVDAINGDYITGDGSFENPWGTFRNLVTYHNPSLKPSNYVDIQPGDYIYVMDGTYTDVIDVGAGDDWGPYIARFYNKHGTEENQFHLKAYPGHSPVFDLQNNGIGIRVSSSSWWEVSGIEIKDSYTYEYPGGLQLSYVDNIKIHNMHIYNSNGWIGANVAGLMMSDMTNIEVYDNIFHDNYAREHVCDTYNQAGEGSSDVNMFRGGNISFHDNYFYRSPELSDCGVALKYKHASDTGLDAYFNVYNNTFDLAPWMFALAAATRNTHFHHNIINGGWWGIDNTNQGGPTYQINHLYEYNTFYNKFGFLFIASESYIPISEIAEITFRNNIVYNLEDPYGWSMGNYAGDFRAVAVGTDSAQDVIDEIAPDFSFNNNCYYHPVDTEAFGIGSGGNFDFDGWQSYGGYGFDADSNFTDPLFVDAANGDFRLQQGSPCQAMGYYGAGQVDSGCVTQFDQPVCDGCIETGELLNAISSWKNGNTVMQELFVNLALWKSPC